MKKIPKQLRSRENQVALWAFWTPIALVYSGPTKYRWLLVCKLATRGSPA
jgi:hypothetical protein